MSNAKSSPVLIILILPAFFGNIPRDASDIKALAFGAFEVLIIDFKELCTTLDEDTNFRQPAFVNPVAPFFIAHAAAMA